MIKKIIFDLDNTLIIWEDKYWNVLNKTFEELNMNYDEILISKIKQAVDNYEKEYNMFSKTTMKKIIEKYTEIIIDDKFIDIWTKHLEKCYPNELDYELKETLEYLSQKYELSVLTNWFSKQQEQRLKGYGILKYFNEVIGTDLVLNKPNKEAFIKACGKYKPEECIMIGDNINVDVIGALNAGLNAILYDNKNNYNGDIKKITKMKELKKIL